VRKLIFGKDDRFEEFLGYHVAAFAVNGYLPRDEDVYVSYGVPGKQVARFAMRDDRTMFLFVFADNQGRLVDPQDTDAHKNALRAEFDQAGWECPQILAAMERCDELYFDRVSQIRMDKWSQGRVGLIGDAAFRPSLLAGQNAALAMVAAYVLAGELGKAGSQPQEAFERYEERLRPFIAGKQKAAVQFAGSFRGQDALRAFLPQSDPKHLSFRFLRSLRWGHFYSTGLTCLSIVSHRIFFIDFK
jgi:2-polyprenyl-6-methoxyphenol hydroxylase-like FAD-dependent oxidoreductase